MGEWLVMVVPRAPRLPVKGALFALAMAIVLLPTLVHGPKRWRVR